MNVLALSAYFCRPPHPRLRSATLNTHRDFLVRFLLTQSLHHHFLQFLNGNISIFLSHSICLVEEVFIQLFLSSSHFFKLTFSCNFFTEVPLAVSNWLAGQWEKVFLYSLYYNSMLYVYICVSFKVSSGICVVTTEPKLQVTFIFKRWISGRESLHWKARSLNACVICVLWQTLPRPNTRNKLLHIYTPNFMKGVLLHSPWLTVAAGDRSYIRIYLVWILKRKIINSSCLCVIRLRNYFHKFKRVGWSSPFFLPLLIWVFFLNLVEAKDKEKIQILNPDFFLLINYLVNLRLNKLRVDPPSS